MTAHLYEDVGHQQHRWTITVLLAATHLMLAIHVSGEARSCVRNITIKESTIPTTNAYTYRLHLDPQCLAGASETRWDVDVVRCDDEEKLLETYKGKKVEGRMCPLQKGCMRLRVGTALSQAFNSSSNYVRLRASILVFDANHLAMALASDPRVRSWNLDVNSCEGENTRRCTKNTIYNVGNATHLFYMGKFSPLYCYYFQIQPVSHDPKCELSSSISKIPNKTCLTPSSSTAAQSTPPPPKGWLTGWVGVGVVGVAVVQGVLVAAFYLRCRTTPRVRRQQAEASKVQQQQQRPTVMLLYAHDDPSSLRQVARLTTWLTHHLGCQVYDIYDTFGRVDQAADPCQCLLGHLAAAPGSVSRKRVVLVASPALAATMKAVLEGRADQAVDGVPPGKRLQTSLLIAALKRLLEKDLVRNYRRVFIVSLNTTEMELSQTKKTPTQMAKTQTEKTKEQTNVTKEVETKQREAEANIDLLVEHRRFLLPLHQDQLSAAILEEKMALEPLSMV